MISSRSELDYYLTEDYRCNDGRRLNKRDLILAIVFPNIILRFLKYLRNYEYWLNNPDKGIHAKISRKYYFYLFRKYSLKLGFTIPPNVFGPGLRIPHYGTIIVHPFAKVGKNCVIQAGVNIGVNRGGVPTIGDDVYIGPGAKIFGGITIGSRVAIGANAVVNKSFLQNDITIAGVPAKIIRNEKADEK
jgi:serine O-acetyltransferase